LIVQTVVAPVALRVAAISNASVAMVMGGITTMSGVLTLPHACAIHAKALGQSGLNKVKIAKFAEEAVQLQIQSRHIIHCPLSLLRIAI
jgi:hypothetical protein